MNARTSKMMTKGTLFSGLFLSLALAVGVAQAAFTGTGSFDFEATGDGLDISGKGPLSVSEDAAAGSVVVSAPLKGVKTGLGMRDEHMFKNLNGEKHPMIKLTVARSALKVPEAGKSVSSTVDGKLSLGGFEKPVKVSYKATQSGDSITVEGTFKTNLYKHGFAKEAICRAGICAAADLEIKAKFNVKG